MKGMNLTKRGEVIRFSTAKTTPCLVLTATAVDPSCKGVKRWSDQNWGEGDERRSILAIECLGCWCHKYSHHPLHTLIASMAYSTWKRRPSGLKVFTPLSYSERVRNISSRDYFF